MLARNIRFCNDQSADEYSEILEAGSKEKRQCVNTLQNNVSDSPIELNQSQQTVLVDAIGYNTFLFQPTYDAQIDYTPQVKFEVNHGYTEMEFAPYFTYGGSQFNILENEFKKSQWLDFQKRRELALTLNLNEIQIENWFANRRVKQIWLEQYNQFCSYQAESVVYSPLRGLSNNGYQVERNLFINNQRPAFKEKYEKCQLPHFNDTFHESTSGSPLINNSATTWVDDQLTKQNGLVQRLPAKTVPSKCDSSSPSPRPRLRSKRTIFSKDQLTKLEQKFEEFRYLNYDGVCELALDLNLTNEQIKTWFKNKRSKQKKLKNLDKILRSPTKTVKSVSSLAKLSKKKHQSSGTFTPFDQIQMAVLEQAFEKYQYPKKDLLIQLAIATNSTEDRVRHWFKIRRREQNLKNKSVEYQTETSNSSTSTPLNLMDANECYQPSVSHTSFTNSSTNLLDQQCNAKNSPSTISQQAAAFLQNWQFQQDDRTLENSEIITSNEPLQSPFSSSSAADYSPIVLVNQQSDIESVLSKINQKTNLCSQDWQCKKYDEVIQISESSMSEKICQSPISHSVTINYPPTAWIAKECDIENELLTTDLEVTVLSQNFQYQKYDKKTSPLSMQQYVETTTLPSIKKKDECFDIAQLAAEYVYAYDNDAAIKNQVTLLKL